MKKCTKCSLNGDNVSSSYPKRLPSSGQLKYNSQVEDILTVPHVFACSSCRPQRRKDPSVGAGYICDPLAQKGSQVAGGRYELLAKQ